MSGESGAGDGDGEAALSQHDDLLRLLCDVNEEASAAKRADLARRIGARRARVIDPFVSVVITGEYKTGKSSLVNALIGADLCPVDEDIATAVPTIVRYAPQTTWLLRRQPGEGHDPQAAPMDPISADDFAAYAVDHPDGRTPPGQPGGPGAVQAVVVGLPSPLLREGLVLVDTPGVGGLVSEYMVATLASLSIADAAVFVSEATKEYTGPELDFLASARQLCPIVVPVLTKIDIATDWKKIKWLNEQWLDKAGLSGSAVATSAALASRGHREQRRDLSQESGLDGLVERLQAIVRDGLDAGARDAVSEVRRVIAQLAAPVRAELDVVVRPSTVIADLERAEELGGRLDSDRAEWLLILDDGLSDLEDRIEVEATALMRSLASSARETVMSSDPASHWDDFEAALGLQVRSNMSAICALVLDGAAPIAERIAEHFAEDEAAIAPTLMAAAGPQLGGVASLATAMTAKFEWRGVLLEAGWGGLEGLAAVGSILTFTTISLFNPFALAIGVFVGGKTLRDARKRELQKRREQAVEAVDRYLQDAARAADRQWRASLRTIRRELRSTYQRRAGELHRSSRESLAAARRRLSDDSRDASSALEDTVARWDRLQALDARALQLAPAAGSSGSGDGSVGAISAAS